jgi:hypothetical protein
MGIEPTPSAWKAEVLPLNYTREHREPQPAGQTGPGHHRPSHPEPGHRVVARPQPSGPDGTAQRTLESCWWRGEDSNLRRLSRQIYSLIPLTAREPLRNERRSIRGPAPGRQPTIGARRRTRRAAPRRTSPRPAIVPATSEPGASGCSPIGGARKPLLSTHRDPRSLDDGRNNFRQRLCRPGHRGLPRGGRQPCGLRRRGPDTRSRC